jgi:hypothetical protein
MLTQLEDIVKQYAYINATDIPDKSYIGIIWKIEKIGKVDEVDVCHLFDSAFYIEADVFICIFDDICILGWSNYKLSTTNVRYIRHIIENDSGDINDVSVKRLEIRVLPIDLYQSLVNKHIFILYR